MAKTISFSKSLKPFVKYQSPALLWGLFICVILLLPSDNISNNLIMGFIPSDKLIHFVLFGILGLFIRVGWAKYYSFFKNSLKPVIYTLISGLIWAIATEILQGVLTDYRHMDILDMTANFSGILASFLLYYIVYKF
jgi:glycopeptide antibiotics resistance protein